MNNGFKFATGTKKTQVDPKAQAQVPQAQSKQPELPPYAKGVDPNGQPYFGDGLQAIGKKWLWNFTKDVKKVDPLEWQTLKDKWSKDSISSTLSGAVKSFGEGDILGGLSQAVQPLGLAAETVGKAFQAGSSGGSPLSGALKFTGATVGALGELFSIPAQKTEQALGAIQGFQDAANDVNSVLPKLDSNPLTRAIEAMPFGIAYDFARLALSNSANKWDEANKKIEEGWQSGRILYSQVFDKTLKEQFLREYRAGGDPALIAMKLQNPLAELGGQLILDPLNAIGVVLKGAKTAKQLAAAEEAVTGGGLLKLEKGAQAFKDLEIAGSDVETLKALDTLAEARTEQIALVSGKSRTLKVAYGIKDLTTGSRREAYVQASKDFIGLMGGTLRNQGMSNDSIVEGIFHGIRSVSQNADEMKAGLSGLSHLPSANMWVSDQATETFIVLKNLMGDTNGVVDGSRLTGLMKAKNPAEFAEEATKLLSRASHAQFPDVSELETASKLYKQSVKGGGVIGKKTAQMAEQFDKLPNHVKQLNKINNLLAEKIKNPINKILSPLYFNWQGGVAVKNIVTNDELILIDQGAKAWVKDGKYWSLDSVDTFLKDVYGELPQSAHGFESLVSAGGGKVGTIGLEELQAAKGFIQKAKVTARGIGEQKFGLIMSVGESAAAKRIVGASVRDTFKKMLVPGKALLNPAEDVAKGFVSKQQADHLANLVYKNNGNVEKAIEEFRVLYKNGNVETWRNLDFMTPVQKNALEHSGYLGEIEALASNPNTTQDDVLKVIEKLKTSIDSRAELAVNDVIGLNADHIGAESWGDIMKAVEEGHLDPNDEKVFTAIMESAEQARMQYSKLLDDIALKAQDALAREGNLAGSQHIGQQMNEIRAKLQQAGPATAKATRRMTKETWEFSDSIKALKKPTAQELASYWKKIGLPGNAPLDLTKESLLKTLWEERFKNVSNEWNAMLDTVVKESETVIKQMGEVVDTTELDAMAAQTRNITQQAQAYRSAKFENKALRVKANGLAPLELADEGIAIPPPHPDGTRPSLPRAWNENAKGLKYVLDTVQNEITSRWGKLTEGAVPSPQMDDFLKRYADHAAPRVAETKAIALRVADQQRKFTLLNYGERTYGDVALSYVMPYHFFYTKSYGNWVQRIATNPEIVAGYGKYKNELETINKDLPDWYKQQLDVTSLLGIETDHPLFFNLEATFNPLYGLTGTDFNDPEKRTNWVTSTFDDMGKFGPTLWAPIQMAIATKLYMDGNTDAAARWGNRIIPETATIKAVSSFFGKPLELDPAVTFFSGGIDPYERSRMGYAAGQLIQSGKYTAEDVQAQFADQQGPAWDEAYQIAVNNRAPAAIMSYFLGVGFKPRSKNDVMIEDMYGKLNQLYAMSDTMDKDTYRAKWDELRSSYPPGMVDAVLLAKKGGDKRDAAYAYNVLGRLPPGKMNEVFTSLGISQEDISKFYESKGFVPDSKNRPDVTWTKTEKQRFMAAIVDMGAMLKIPDDATQKEWSQVRSQYSGILSEVEKQLGSDIWNKVSHYYDLKDDDKKAAEDFKQLHPEVVQALQLKQAGIANTPLVDAYYGGLDTIESYISGNVRQLLTEKYGQDIYDKQTEYYNLGLESKGKARAYLAQHPELKKYWEEKAQMEDAGNKLYLQMGQQLPEQNGAQVQEGYTPQSGVQKNILAGIQTPKIPSFDELVQSTEGNMTPAMQEIVQAYWTTGEPLKPAATKQLTYLASRYGEQYGATTGDDFLRLIGLSMQTAPPQAAAPSGFQFGK